MDDTRICKVCGKSYKYCRTNKRVEGVFRWQDVSCCAEHGSIYLAQVIASREESTETEPIVDNQIDIDYDEEYDDEEVDWFDDESDSDDCEDDYDTED